MLIIDRLDAMKDVLVFAFLDRPTDLHHHSSSDRVVRIYVKRRKHCCELGKCPRHPEACILKVSSKCIKESEICAAICESTEDSKGKSSVGCK